jgi:hypothetical protein
MNATCLLPPTARDFDIQRMSLVLHFTTRSIAAKHGLSQTRVRQIVRRVCDWLAVQLPVKSEAEQEQEARLARHLAADQLHDQIEQLQRCWDQTYDPKFIRQQTRVITALGRLGIVPGTIDALAADATEGPLDPSEPQTPWSEEDPGLVTSVPPGNAVPRGSSRAEPPTSGNHKGRSLLPEGTWNCPDASLAGQRDLPNGRTETQADCRSEIGVPEGPARQAGPTYPPAGDCSAFEESPADGIVSAGSEPASSDSPTRFFDDEGAELQCQIANLKRIEADLLAAEAAGQFNDPQDRAVLAKSLAVVRHDRAAVELRIAPHIVGASVQSRSLLPEGTWNYQDASLAGQRDLPNGRTETQGPARQAGPAEASAATAET